MLELTGTVTSSEARWSADGQHIRTYASVRTEDGETITVSQLGGSVGDLAMRQFPSQPLLRRGDRFRARALAGAEGYSLVSLAELERAELPGAAPALPGPSGAEPARNFVRTTTAESVPLYWAGGCVYITFDEAGTSHIADLDEFAVMEDALDHWRSSTRSCSYMNFVLAEPRTTEVGFDGVNLVKFRDERWCRPDGEGGEQCHPADAAGLTTLTFVNNPESERYGEILDADIEINGADRFAISVDGETEVPETRCLADLGNTFTHEVGHLLGLDHTCRFSGDAPAVDHEGDEVPLCSGALNPEILEATMHPSQTCGETKKASLEDDDINAICSIYPQAEDPDECKPISLTGERSWCSVAPAAADDAGNRRGTWALALLGLGGLLLAQRRRAVAPVR